MTMHIPTFFNSFAARITGKPLVVQLADINRMEAEDEEREAKRRRDMLQAPKPAPEPPLSDMATPARKAIMHALKAAEARRHTQAIHKHRAELKALATRELKGE